MNQPTITLLAYHKKKEVGHPYFTVSSYSIMWCLNPLVIHWYYVKSVNVFTGLLLSLKV